jgi:hypothetical protein
VELLNKYPGEPHVNGFSWQSYLQFRDRNHVLTALIGSAPATLSCAPRASIRKSWIVNTW